MRFATEGTRELPEGFQHDAVDDAYFRALLSLFRRPASPERDEMLTKYRHGHQRDKWNLLEVRETWKQQDELRRSTGERVTAILKADADPAQWLKEVFDVFGVLLGEQPGGTTAKMLGDVWARLQPGAKKKTPPKKLPQQKRGAPTKEELVQYWQAVCREKGAAFDLVEAEKCFDHYESNGWKQSSGQPIVNWKAAVRNWMRRVPEFQREMKQQDSVYGSDASYDLAAFTRRAVGLQD